MGDTKVTFLAEKTENPFQLPPREMLRMAIEELKEWPELKKGVVILLDDAEYRYEKARFQSNLKNSELLALLYVVAHEVERDLADA